MLLRFLLLPPALASLACAAAASAEEPVPPDIVVTGEKRETPLQTAPLAITAVTGASMAQRNMNQINDLNGFVPGLAIAKSEGAERVIAIRGIGYETAQNPNSQPGVAFHIDGVYVAHVVALNQDLLDVDRVEALRGPQGTVFGETATGGAVNVITHKPVIGEAGGTASISLGNHDYLKATAAANLPLAQTVSARVAVQYLHYGPYGISVAVPGYPHYPLEDAGNLALRGALLWKPDHRFSLLLEAQGFSTDRSAALQKDIADVTPGKRRVAQDFPGAFRMRSQLAYLTLSYDLGAAVARSVTSYQFLDKHQTADNDRGADPLAFDHITLWQDRSRAVTQEISLSSTGTRPLEWTVGGFFLRQHALQNIVERTTPALAAITLTDGSGIKFQTDSPYQHTGLAAYGNATWRPGGGIGLIAGARYNYDRITAQPVQYFATVPPRAASSRAVTGKVGVEYRPLATTMLYLTGSQGYKPTGLNFNATPLFVPTRYHKETVTAIEGGLKAEVFDRRLRINVAGYHYWYRDFQFTAEDPQPFSGGTDNVPRARIYGAELEASARPFAGLQLDGSVSYGRGRFRGHFLTIDAQTAAEVRSRAYAALGFPPAYYFDPRIVSAVAAARQDLDGNRVPKLPTWQARFSPAYAWHMAGGRVTLGGDVVHRGAFDYRLFAVAALDRVPAYTIFNAHLAYQPDHRPWSASISALNLGDKAGVNSRFSDPYGSGRTSVEYIDPRQLFATLSFRW